MTAVYLTIDTEYAAHLPGANGTPGARADNFARSIDCATPSGRVGILHQMDVLDAHGLKGVFFVDPMPALLWGLGAIEDVVAPIMARGHDVQLHCHTEWIDHAQGGLLGAMGRGRNLKDFGRDEQRAILGYARETLIAAGAPAPVAFRAGNYGANDDTLAVLAELGIAYDSSHSPALVGRGDCAISLGSDDLRPVEHRGVIEVPVACVESFGGSLRHGQLTALSLHELVAAIRHARDTDIGSVTLVSHSFELLSRERLRINRVVARRFARLCAAIADMPGVSTATYADQPPAVGPAGKGSARLPHDPFRSGMRLIEQAVSNAFYSRPVRATAQPMLAVGAALLT